MKIKETKSLEGLTPLQKIFSAPMRKGHKLWRFTKSTSVLEWLDIKELPRNKERNVIIIEEKGVLYATSASRKSAIKVFSRLGFSVFKNGNSPSVDK